MKLRVFLFFSHLLMMSSLMISLLPTSTFAGTSQAELSRFFEEQLNRYGNTFNEALVSDEPEFVDLEMLGLSLEAGVGFALPWIGKIELRPELELEWKRESINRVVLYK